MWYAENFHLNAGLSDRRGAVIVFPPPLNDCERE